MSKATPDSHTSHLAEQNASSGLFDLSGEEWRCALGAVNHFDDCAEVFLGQWTLRMKAAGYLSFTTARREDCMTSCDGLLDAMKGHADRNTPPSFETLRTNADGWADALKSSVCAICGGASPAACFWAATRPSRWRCRMPLRPCRASPLR